MSCFSKIRQCLPRLCTPIVQIDKQEIVGYFAIGLLIVDEGGGGKFTDVDHVGSFLWT